MTVSSKAANMIIYDEFDKKKIAILYKLVIRMAITNPYSRIAVYGETEYVGRSSPKEGTSSQIQATYSGVVNTVGQERGGMSLNRRESLLWASEYAF